MFLLIDNYDSFTYNLVHYVAMLGEEVRVYRNDEISVSAVLELNPTGVILSPGPCDPDQAGICLELVLAASVAKKPLLGVCLGHQTIGQVFGGKVIRAPEPIHGKTSLIQHQQQGIFAHIPTPYQATRYHSLIVERATLPSCLEVTAETDDGLIMGLQHKELPIHGVQFHPESIATHYGHQLLDNFVKLAKGQKTATLTQEFVL